MMKRILFCLVAFIGIAFDVPFAEAQTSDDAQGQSAVNPSDLNVQAGLRLWGNEWDIPVFSLTPVLGNNGTPVIQEQVTNRRSNFKFVPIPVLGISYGRFLGNMTYMVPTHYDAGVEGLSSVRREEFDASFGYSILPPTESSVLVGTISYKYAKIGSTATGFDVPTTINAVLFGLTGTAPLYEKLRIQGSFAIGPARQRLNTPTGEEKDNALYSVVELGVSYPLISESHGLLNSLILTVGYRAQIYTIKDVQFTTADIQTRQVIGTESRDVTSTTQGPVIGLIGSF